MQEDTLVLTPEATLVYPSLFEPTAFKNEDPAYKATLLISKAEDLKPMRNACRSAALRKWGQNVQTQQLRSPIRDGDQKAMDENGNIDKTNFYFGNVFINAKSKWQPQIVNIYNEFITDENELYGGCIVRAYISFFGYDFAGNRGVSAGLRAICKISDGTPLGGGRIDTADAFKDFIKEKPSFMDGPPMDSKEYNEGPGQRNDDPLRDSNPWGDNEPPQEPDFVPPDDDSVPF
jgi:hypothetical protein